MHVKAFCIPVSCGVRTRTLWLIMFLAVFLSAISLNANVKDYAPRINATRAIDRMPANHDAGFLPVTGRVRFNQQFKEINPALNYSKQGLKP